MAPRPIRGPALEAGRPSNVEIIEADGSVECVVLLPQNGRPRMRVLLCIFLDKDLVATFDPQTGSFNDTEDAQSCDKMASYLAIESFAVQVDDERWLPEGSRAAKILADNSGEAATWRMLNLWTPLGLVPDLNEAERPNALASLKTGGLKTALSLDEATLGKIARLSLSPSGSLSGDMRDEANEQTQWLGAINDKSREVLGFNLFGIIDGKIASSRV
jgi:hypothetical protein